MGTHQHGLGNYNPGSGTNLYCVNSDRAYMGNAYTNTNTGRAGTTTHGKRKGVKYIIKVL